jgi:DNA-binding CsgD family transcriptional regulator
VVPPTHNDVEAIAVVYGPKQDVKAAHLSVGGSAIAPTRVHRPSELRAPSELLAPSEWNAIIGVLHLSPREAQMVQIAFHDESVLIIAGRLGVSEHTVHTYRERLFRKLGVRTFCQVLSVVFAAFLVNSRGDTSAGDTSGGDTPATDLSRSDSRE